MASELASRHHSLGQLLAIGREHFEQQARVVGGLRVAGLLLVDQPGAVELQRQRAFAVRLLGQQHAPHVGVLDDAHLRRGRVLGGCGPCCIRLLHQPALRAALARSRARRGSRPCRAWWRPCRRRCAPRSSCGTCSAGPCRARRPGSPRHRPCRRPGTCPRRSSAACWWCRASPSLWFRPASATSLRSPVSWPLVSTMLLGHDEQRDAARARDQLAVLVGDLGQHDVHDVLGQLVVARRDPHLVAA